MTRWESARPWVLIAVGGLVAYLAAQAAIAGLILTVKWALR